MLLDVSVGQRSEDMPLKSIPVISEIQIYKLELRVKFVFRCNFIIFKKVRT